MDTPKASDSVIRDAGTADVVNADPRKEYGSSTADSSTPIAPQPTTKENEGDAADDYTDPRSEAGRSF